MSSNETGTSKSKAKKPNAEIITSFIVLFYSDLVSNMVTNKTDLTMYKPQLH